MRPAPRLGDLRQARSRLPPWAGEGLARLVYVSRAAPRLGRAGLYDIIRAAHAHNPAQGICGALILLDGWFVQVLEGAPGRLDDCFARIGRDPRHGRIELRLRTPILCPVFAGHPMDLRSRACLDPALLEDFGYRPGFPVEAFPADNLIEFVIRACRRSAERRAAP